MGIEIGGKWAGKPWRREVHYTHAEAFGTSACLWGFEVGFLWEDGQLGLRGVPLHPPVFWFLLVTFKNTYRKVCVCVCVCAQ